MTVTTQQLRTVQAGTAPADLLPGQFALDITNGNCWYGNSSNNPVLLTSRTFVQETPPSVGLLDTNTWFKPSTQEFYLYHAGAWKLLGISKLGGSITGTLDIRNSANTSSVLFIESNAGSAVSNLDWTHNGGFNLNGDLNISGSVTLGGSPLANLFTPPGSIQMYAGALTLGPPDGWLFANGAQVQRSVYPELYNAVGDIYGVPANNTLFVLPNVNGMFPRFWSDSRNDEWADPDRNAREDRGDGIGGDNVGSRQKSAMEDHIHGLSRRNGEQGNEIDDIADEFTSLTGQHAGTSSPAAPTTTDWTNPDYVNVSTENRPTNIYLIGLIKT